MARIRASWATRLGGAMLAPMWLRLMMTWVVGSALVGCGGARANSVGGASGPRADDSPSDCPPGQFVLASSCWGPRGTRWQVRADGPAGDYNFEVEMLAASRLRATDHAGADPASDEWFQDGPLLRMFLSDRFVEYRAQVTNGTILVGEAENVRGQAWSFRARRLFGESACGTHEARVQDACMTMSGTHWRLSGDGIDESTVHFMGEGQLAFGSNRPSESDRWEQNGASLALTFGEHRMTATIAAEDTLEGEFVGREGRWRAEILALVAPVFHR